ncbi:MAG TPA: ATP-binding protein [Acidimicrobiales bacterium]|nr:ATP-binding protein [Acidimicrobiales bacterium]
MVAEGVTTGAAAGNATGQHAGSVDGSVGRARRRLRDRLSEHEENVFVGRETELARVDAVIDGRDDRVLLFVHGPGGIGKTTLLKRIEQRARRLGWPTTAHSSPGLIESEGATDNLVAWAAAQERALLTIDRWDEAGAGAVGLRDEVLALLPDTTVIVLAGRNRPDPEWWGEGWSRLTLDLPLAPLDRSDALRLLALHGVTDAERATELARWARGSPLALAMAAGAGADLDPSESYSTATVVAGLSRRLLEGDLPEDRIAPLAVAATARVTTPSLLAAALPGIDAAEAYGWLGERSYAERWGGGIVLHALVAGVLRTEISQRHPDLVREVRRRLTDHLWVRALRAGTPFVPDLLHLVDDPRLRWGIGWDDQRAYRMDRLRAGDVEQLAAFWDQSGHQPQWRWITRYATEAPATVGIARDRAGRVCGIAIWVTPRSAPPLASDDPLLGPWLDHARRSDPEGNAVLWRTANDLTGEPDNPVQGLLGAAGIRRCGLPNPRRVYLPINPAAPRAVAFAAAVGAVHVPQLDLRTDADDVTECHVADLGPGGVLGAYRDVIYAELGLQAPAPEAVPSDAVREALRHWDNPVALAASPLAEGTTVVERCEAVRRLVRTGLEAAFGDSADDALLREVIERGYLSHALSHEATARQLGLSRAAYFRKLREAAERVSHCLPA